MLCGEHLNEGLPMMVVELLGWGLLVVTGVAEGAVVVVRPSAPDQTTVSWGEATPWVLVDTGCSVVEGPSLWLMAASIFGLG